MSTDRLVKLQRWGMPFLYEEQEDTLVHEAQLIELIRTLPGEQSAILFIEAGDKLLGINASGGLFSVEAQVDEETSVELVGDESAAGEITFVLGGQEVSLPRRYLVSLDQARGAALEFFHNGTVDTTRGWDAQRPDSP